MINLQAIRQFFKTREARKVIHEFTVNATDASRGNYADLYFMSFHDLVSNTVRVHNYIQARLYLQSIGRHFYELHDPSIAFRYCHIVLMQMKLSMQEINDQYLDSMPKHQAN